MKLRFKHILAVLFVAILCTACQDDEFIAPDRNDNILTTYTIGVSVDSAAQTRVSLYDPNNGTINSNRDNFYLKWEKGDVIKVDFTPVEGGATKSYNFVCGEKDDKIAWFHCQVENEADLLDLNTTYKYVSDYTDVPHEVYVQEKPNSMSHFNNKLFTLLHADSELTQYGNKPLTGLDLVNGAKIAFETRPMTDEDIEQNFVIYKVNLQGILYDIYPGSTLTIQRQEYAPSGDNEVISSAKISSSFTYVPDTVPSKTFTKTNMVSNVGSAGKWTLVDGTTTDKLTLTLGNKKSWRVKVNFRRLADADTLQFTRPKVSSKVGKFTEEVTNMKQTGKLKGVNFETNDKIFEHDEFIIDTKRGFTDKPFFDVEPVKTGYTFESTGTMTDDDVRSLCGYASGDDVLSCYIMVKKGEFYEGDAQIVLHDAYSEDEYHWFLNLAASTQQPNDDPATPDRKFYVINCTKAECIPGIYMGKQSLWGVRNMGARSLTDPGRYYRWGDVTGYYDTSAKGADFYKWSSYQKYYNYIKNHCCILAETGQNKIKSRLTGVFEGWGTFTKKDDDYSRKIPYQYLERAQPEKLAFRTAVVYTANLPNEANAVRHDEGNKVNHSWTIPSFLNAHRLAYHFKTCNSHLVGSDKWTRDKDSDVLKADANNHNTIKGVVYERTRTGHRIFFPKSFMLYTTETGANTDKYNNDNTAFMCWTRSTLTYQSAIVMLYGPNRNNRLFMSYMNSAYKSIGLPIRAVYPTDIHMGPDGEMAYPWYHDNNYRGGMRLISDEYLAAAQAEEKEPGDGERDAYLDTYGFTDPTK